MRIHRFSFIFAALLLALAGSRSTATPQLPPFGLYTGAEFSPEITILESGDSMIQLHLEMDNLRPPEQSINLRTDLQGTMENLDNQQLYSLMPRLTFYLALPSTGAPTVNAPTWETTTYNVVAGTIQENDPEPPRVRLGHVGVFGGVRVVPLTIYPVTYHNGESTCEVVTNALIEIAIDGSPGELPVSSDRPDFSLPWQRAFRSLVLNWEYIPNYFNGVRSHLLVFCPDDYIAQIEPFLDWKEQKGMKVTLVNLNDLGENPSPFSFRGRIIDEYENSSPKIDHVLLVGDESQGHIPVSYRTTQDPPSRFSEASLFGSYTDENYYRAIIGGDNDDVFPDVFLGRWVVNSPAEVATVVNRTITHEKNPLALNPERFTRCAVSADFSEPTMEVTKQYVRSRMLQHGFSVVDTIWAVDSPGPQLLINKLNAGITFLNHRGAGWNNGWAGINFHNENIGSVNNVGSLPVITGIGCGVAKFDESDNNCFGERWMTAGTVSQPSGAVGFIGPCWNTHTIYNNNLDSSIYKAILDHDVLNLAAALAAGKVYTWGIFEDFLDEPAVLEICKTMFRQFQVLSDPSLQLYTRTPVQPVVTMPDAIPAGEFPLPVSILNVGQLPADSLLMTIWYGAGNYDYRWITPGEPSFTFPVEASPGQTVVVTITGDNVAAFYRTLEVNPPGPYVMHQTQILDDFDGGNGNGLMEPGETIRWLESVWNIGDEAAEDVTATLSCESDLMSFTQTTADLGTIGAGDVINAEAPFIFSIAAEAPDATTTTFMIHYEPTNGGARSTDLLMPVYAPDIEFESMLVNDDGGNGLLERWEGANLSFELSNFGNLANTTGTITLTTDDPFLEIHSGQSALPAVPPYENYMTPASDLRVAASGVTPSGHIAELTLTISAQMDAYTYQQTLPVELTIGRIESSDPVADTEQQYWFYDNTDQIYEQGQREFEWIEIAPTAGGPGSLVNPVSSQQTFPVQLPFIFSYYGVNYDWLSISTDGWVAPGATSFTSYINYPLPYRFDNVGGMIAPLWDDLWYRFNDQETGQICYYYDDSTDRFIVEWYGVHHWQYLNFVETFQVQLLNPATYPTASGDAEWVFVYQEVSPLTLSSQGGTVGIESPDSQDGATCLHESVYNIASAPLMTGRTILITTNAPVILGADDDPTTALPTEILLAQNYPNPFNPETQIHFSLPAAMNARLEVFNILGQRVATLVDARLNAGNHFVTWDGRNSAGVFAGSGVYLYRLATPQSVQSRKMVLLK